MAYTLSPYLVITLAYISVPYADMLTIFINWRECQNIVNILQILLKMKYQTNYIINLKALSSMQWKRTNSLFKQNEKNSFPCPLIQYENVNLLSTFSVRM